MTALADGLRTMADEFRSAANQLTPGPLPDLPPEIVKHAQWLRAQAFVLDGMADAYADEPDRVSPEHDNTGPQATAAEPEQYEQYRVRESAARVAADILGRNAAASDALSLAHWLVYGAGVHP